MKLVYGTIRGFSDETRVFEILQNNKVEMYYLTRSQYKKFKPYIDEGLVVHFTCKDTKTKQFIEIKSINGKKKPLFNEKKLSSHCRTTRKVLCRVF